MENSGTSPAYKHLLSKVRNIIVDIEGTTTSISFVKDTLFTYIRENLLSYLRTHWDDPQLKEDILLLKEQADEDVKNNVDGAAPLPKSADDNMLQAVVKNVVWQMDLDRKTMALKQLQGHILNEGFKNGKLKGHVYADVVDALQSWTKNGRKVYVYSSGSIEAQKLLFGYSQEGNLLGLFSGHFDTSIGPKVESQSYINIRNTLNCNKEDILFLTDVPKEAIAAQGAGLFAVLVVREGNAPLSEEDRKNFPVIHSFHDLTPSETE